MTVCKLASLKMSGYGLIARVVLEEKGVPYERVEILPEELGSSEYKTTHHPFGKVPVLFHGDLHLFETAAIARYVDETFDGPTLQPATPALRAEMQKWINVLSQYIYPSMVGGLVLPRITAQMGGPPADEEAVKVAVAEAAYQLGLLDAKLADGSHLAGDFSLADIFVASIVQYIPFTPEGKDLLSAHPTTEAWVTRITTRPSYGKAAWE